MVCKKYMRPVYLCQHVLPVPEKTYNSDYGGRTTVRQLVDGTCPFEKRVLETSKAFDCDRVLDLTCAHLSPVGKNCSCAQAIAEANGKGDNPNQLSLFDLKEA